MTAASDLGITAASDGLTAEDEAWADALSERLESLATPDGLIDFFKELASVMTSQPSTARTQAAVNRQSPLGLYLRRCNVEFDRLPFEASFCHPPGFSIQPWLEIGVRTEPITCGLHCSDKYDTSILTGRAVLLVPVCSVPHNVVELLASCEGMSLS